MKRFVEAKINYNIAISLDKSFIAPRIKLSVCLSAEGNATADAEIAQGLLQEAYGVIIAANGLFPDSVDVWCEQARFICEVMKGKDDCFKLFDIAIMKGPNQTRPLVEKGWAMMQIRTQTLPISFAWTRKTKRRRRMPPTYMKNIR